MNMSVKKKKLMPLATTPGVLHHSFISYHTQNASLIIESPTLPAKISAESRVSPKPEPKP